MYDYMQCGALHCDDLNIRNINPAECEQILFGIKFSAQILFGSNNTD